MGRLYDNNGNFTDDKFGIKDNADPTKLVQFQVSGLTTATTRTLTVPDESGTIVTNATGGTAVGVPQRATGTLTNTNMVNLRATPITLVAAPGAGKVIQIISGALYFDYTAAYTETADNMALKYTNGSGSACSETIEATGFVDAAADTFTNIIPIKDTIVAKTGCDNQAVVIHNTGDGEYGGGNAANVVRWELMYVIRSTGW